jgi:uncharacterized protein YutE (UPF0331/DUF86 family)
MMARIQSLPLGSLEDFTENPHIPASAESYLRRGLEALFDLGRHLLAKGFGRAAIEYKSISRELQQAGVLDPASADLMYQMAGYRNRLVHFYDEVTIEELYRVCTQDLADVDQVIETIAQWIRDHPDCIDESL